MFEIHGWATIRYTAENRDRPEEDELQAAAVDQVHQYVQQLGYDQGGDNVSGRDVLDLLRPHYSGEIISAAKANVVIGLRILNGEAQLWAAGFKNHAAPLAQDILDLFVYISGVAPGSYGLLYTLDDEDPAHENAFRVFVLARGTLTERADPFLSPFVPCVEDPYREG
jgi:Immunity protein 7